MTAVPGHVHVKVIGRMEELEARYDTLLTQVADWKREVTNCALEVIHAEGDDYEEAVTRLLDAALRGGTHIRREE